MDRLAVLLDHFAFTADSYHQGAFCGVSRHADGEATGQVHLLRGGRLSFATARGGRLCSAWVGVWCWETFARARIS